MHWPLLQPNLRRNSLAVFGMSKVAYGKQRLVLVLGKLHAAQTANHSVVLEYVPSKLLPRQNPSEPPKWFQHFPFFNPPKLKQRSSLLTNYQGCITPLKEASCMSQFAPMPAISGFKTFLCLPPLVYILSSISAPGVKARCSVPYCGNPQTPGRHKGPS